MRWFLRTRFSHADVAVLGVALAASQRFGLVAGLGVAAVGAVAVVLAEWRWRG